MPYVSHAGSPFRRRLPVKVCPGRLGCARSSDHTRQIRRAVALAGEAWPGSCASLSSVGSWVGNNSAMSIPARRCSGTRANGFPRPLLASDPPASPPAALRDPVRLSRGRLDGRAG